MKLSIPEIEKSILAYWHEHDVFKKSVEQNPETNRFVFYDGPPFATGLPHHGSLLASVIKDVIPRYKTMRGFRVDRVWGWDCHGLPIENMVEKELGLKSKKDIEQLGLEKFNNTCRASVLKYDREWRTYVDRTGRWVDFDNSYKTMDNSYIESVWWGFKTLHEKGLVYEGRHICLYCPRCATPLSNFEIAMDNSYKMLTDHSTYVKFAVKGEAETFFLAWTTTPWTLPGNVAVLVSKDADYTKVKHQDQFYYVAKSLAQKLVGDAVEIVETMKGADLVGKEYEPLYTYMPLEGKKAYYVGAADFVSLEDGSGLVHTAAVYGEDDYRYAQANNLPCVATLDDQGKFLEFVTPFKGLFYKKAEQPIVDDLQARGLLFKDEPYTHSYPVCYRCETPLYYNAVPAWFISVTKIKERMLALNEKINWYPEHLKHGRFQHGLESAPDWNISRNRYWGSPIPVWKCDECSHLEIIGSVDELKKNTGSTEVADLHRPAIDNYSWKCKSCKKGTMKRVLDVFDCWVESGSMPFASMHYPFENKEAFEKHFPGEFIAEYIAQTRGWFYTLHVLSTALFDKPAFSNAVTTGTIQAADGLKMSKSKKNYTDPLKLFDQYGADSFRFYLMTSPVMQAENLNFSDDAVKDIMRKVVMMLVNIQVLYKTYAHASDKLPTPDELKELPLTALDRWILARFNQTVSQSTEQLDRYDVVRPGRAMLDFINDFSTWYLRRSRDRFKGQDESDKRASLVVTRYVTEQLLKLLAPYTPFITEHLYRDLYANQTESIHLQPWPMPVDWMNNQVVIDEMVIVRRVVEVALSARAEAKVKIRQALERLLIKLPAGMKELSADYQQLIADEVNVMHVQVVASIEAQPGYGIKQEQDVHLALKTDLSPELLQAGLARELVRNINSLRKQAGLNIDSRININYKTDSDFVTETLQTKEADILAETLADALLPETPRDELKKLVKFGEHEVEVGIVVS